MLNLLIFFSFLKFDIRYTTLPLPVNFFSQFVQCTHTEFTFNEILGGPQSDEHRWLSHLAGHLINEGFHCVLYNKKNDALQTFCTNTMQYSINASCGQAGWWVCYFLFSSTNHYVQCHLKPCFALLLSWLSNCLLALNSAVPVEICCVN